MKRKREEKLKKAIPFLLILICVVFGFGLFYFKETETEDIELQEQVSQTIADEYLVQMTQREEQLYDEDLEYQDNEIYGDFSENNARGHVDCVLEIPSLDLRQSIFTGSVEQIEHDLRNWLPVTARADYKLGETHYCIYSHNPKNKSIRFSYAQELMKRGDYMIVTQKDRVYLYEVSNLFSEWRDKCTEKYVDNMSLKKELLYIFTCGRNEWQYKNVVVEGTLYDVYSIKDWNKNKTAYIEKCKREMQGKYIEQQKEGILMDISSVGEELVVSLKTETNKMVTDVSIGVFNSDGYLVEGFENPIKYEGTSVKIPKLEKGTYCIGLYENNTDYQDPAEYEITIDTRQVLKDMNTIDAVMSNEEEKTETTKLIAIGMMSTAVIMGIGTITMSVLRKRRDKNEDC